MAKVKLADYKEIVGPRVIEELLLLGERLQGIPVKMVNSTAVGGGVAEILHRMLPLMNEIGIHARWEVIKGGQDFFAVTKTFHNALHGDKVEVTEQMFDIFREYTEANLAEISFPEDIVVIHDPQPAGLIAAKEASRARWIWRCHIDLSHPHVGVWEFLRNFVVRYDASIFSAPSFAKELPIPQIMIHPSIDPLADKNKELPNSHIDKVLEKYKIPRDRPIVTQISRFDRLKDPVGVIEAFRLVRKRTPCQLVIAGGWASDDPESAKVLVDVQEKAGNDPDIHVLTLPPFSDLEINALQRASAVVLQKSLREGFGLTVTEALWKGRPVVASAVGGIPLQIRHNLTGMLVHSIEGAAYQIRTLLNNPELAKKLGQMGREHVRSKFLLTRNLRDYLLLFISLLHPGESVIQL